MEIKPVLPRFISNPDKLQDPKDSGAHIDTGEEVIVPTPVKGFLPTLPEESQRTTQVNNKSLDGKRLGAGPSIRGNLVGTVRETSSLESTDVNDQKRRVSKTRDFMFPKE
jgi:hypothetical protein